MRTLIAMLFMACVPAYLCSCSQGKSGKQAEDSAAAYSDAGHIKISEKNKKTKCEMKMKTPSGNILCLEKAVSPAEREKGLMFREELKKGHGMIFFFDDDEKKAFWMKNTLISLDIIFLDEYFTVMKVFANVPSSYIGAPEREIPAVAWWGRYVLEIPGGSYEEYGIKFGSRLELALPDAMRK